MTEVEAFCIEHHPRIVGILTLYCGDQAVAEELAQEALMRAWARWNKVAKLDSPSGWLYRVAINLANSWLRRRRAEQRARARMRAEHPGEITQPSAAAVAVRDAVARLGRRQRTVIVLHYFLDMPFAQIAQVMDTPVGTVKSLAQRGRARLHMYLGEEEHMEVPDAI